MRWPWRRRAQLIDPGLPPNLRIIELQTAKEILAEVFHARPSEEEEMIQRRLEERSWDEQEVHQEDLLWPREFCMGE
jgi:ribose 1,5-bisphosphokinase PhnN